MCSYIGIKVSKTAFIKLKKLEKQIGELGALKVLQNGFEYKDWAIIRANPLKNDIEIEQAHWEFIPNWINTDNDLKKARKQGIPWLNATAENLLSSKMFSDAAKNRRCLIPISHFFEWRHIKHVGGKKPVTYPYCISGSKNEILFLAGIYTPWFNKSTGISINTFAIITTQANEKMANIHNTKMRMPTILNETLAHEWLFGNLNEPDISRIAAYQIPSDDLSAYSIAKDFRTSLSPLNPFEFESLSSIE
jgi:putative SOS response-associated peptidase YedK